MVLGDRSANGTNVNSTAMQTKGICFLGTPFLGSDKAKWGKKLLTFLDFFGAKTQTKNVNDMKHESAALVELNEALSTVFDKRKDPDSVETPIDIACFFEAHPTKGLVVCPCLHLSRTNTEPYQIVDRDSAGPWGRIRTPIDADHNGICKFGPSDIGYQHVLSALKSLIAPYSVPKKKV